MGRQVLIALRPLALAAALLLGACATTGPAPVDDLSGAAPRPAARAPQPAAGVHRVVRGDTLYSIAFRNGLDYRDVARWNGIGEPYTIYVGQEIRLNPGARATAPAQVVAAAPARPTATPPPTPPAAALPAPFEDVKPSAPAQSPATPQAPAPAAAASAATAGAPDAPAAPAAAAATGAATVATATPPPAAEAAVGSIRWRWPAEGRVIDTFVAGDRTRQGIDIAGRAGDPVRAAADGTVVYSGDGLIGYGELIIIKHSPSFLSAYGHNRKRLVKEGDRVQAGQVIAEMGTSNTNREALHFEVRRNGKPENPLVFLPRR